MSLKDTNAMRSMEEILFGTDRVARMNMIESNLYYSIKSLSFLLAVFGTAFAIFTGIFTELVKAFRSDNLLAYGFHNTLLQQALESDVFVFALTIICVLPYTTSYIDDLKSGYIKLYIVRAKRSDYLLGKIVACMVSGGLALVLGIVLSYIVMLLVFIPMEAADDAASWAGTWSETILPLLDMILRIFMQGAMWSMVGMAAAAFTSSKYMAYAGPFIFYYVLIILCERYFKDCYVIYPKEWLVLDKFPFGSIGVLIFIIEVTILICSVFYLHEKRRLGSL